MVKLINADTRLEAWLDATEYLLEQKSALNVILSIENPGSDGTVANDARDIIDEYYISEEGYSLHTIAETIFPGWEYRKQGIQGVYETYAEEEYPIISQRWGTYAYRLLRRQDNNGNFVNPLKNLIEKMSSELSASNGGAKRSCYEIGVAEGAYDMPLYNTTDDKGRRMGAPCLSHLSFKLYDNSVHLTAIYRSHDYRLKVPGNLLGLARLQACVANEVGVPIGSLVVHSTYAYIDKGIRGLKKIVAEIRELTEQDKVDLVGF